MLSGEEKKIIFVDLDGTLLRADKTVSEHTKEVVKRMIEAGHIFCIDTGRPTRNAIDLLKKLDFLYEGMYLISFNGSQIYDPVEEKSLAKITLTMEEVRYLFAEAEKYNLHIQSYTDEAVVMPDRGPESQEYISRTDVKVIVTEDVPGFLTEEPCKALLIDLKDEERLLQFQRDHREWEKGRTNSFFSCPQYLEYCKADKGTAAKTLWEMLEIHPQNTYAAGDERNDVPMLQTVTNGFAMKNGSKEAKEAAPFETAVDNDHDGVAWIIEEYILKG